MSDKLLFSIPLLAFAIRFLPIILLGYVIYRQIGIEKKLNTIMYKLEQDKHTRS